MRQLANGSICIFLNRFILIKKRCGVREDAVTSRNLAPPLPTIPQTSHHPGPKNRDLDPDPLKVRSDDQSKRGGSISSPHAVPRPPASVMRSGHVTGQGGINYFLLIVCRR